ncbi:RecB family exonuclease [Clostridium sardiniense]|uniref:RecB family exonuclease n=1 Tax=Clostridium sardiniense TaxID=29369 RepID=UPI001958A718|nr:PD-(D/E)XK nuclease family protein [Clostridium sardiniense]MBM7836481.1 RecB family exonuclease [Clostridium sardiniense]
MSDRNYEIKEENKGLPIYSFSKLSTYHHCKYAYFLQYIKHIRGKQNIYGATGESAHNAAQDLVKNKINNQQAYKRFLEELDETLNILGLNFPTEKSGINYKECVGDFILRYKPKHKKYDIERGFDVIVGDSKSVMLGFIDLIYWNEDGTIDIVDYKTSSQFSKKDFEEKKLQLLAYAYALQKEGFKINKLYFNMLKYCNLEWDEINSKKQLVHKSLKSDRNAIGLKLKATAKRLFKKMGLDDIEIESRIENMIKTNKIDDLLSETIEITDFCVNVSFEKQDIQDFINWFENTINDINEKCKDLDEENPSDKNFPPVQINKGSEFFCNLLCGQDCKYFNEYKEGNKNSYQNRKKTMEETIDDLEDLL